MRKVRPPHIPYAKGERKQELLHNESFIGVSTINSAHLDRSLGKFQVLGYSNRSTLVTPPKHK